MNSFLGRNDDSCAFAMLRRGSVLEGMLEGVWAEIGNWFDHKYSEFACERLSRYRRQTREQAQATRCY